MKWIDVHTVSMNVAYGLNEEEWPSYFGTSNERVVMSYCYTSEHKPDRWTEHEWQKHLFSLWHEIEQRGLYHETAPEQGTFSYPWEKQKHPFSLSDPNNPERETFAESIAGSRSASPFFIGEGRRRKIGGPSWEDEENMGLYRRERKDG